MVEQLQRIAKKHALSADALQELEDLLTLAAPRTPTQRLSASGETTSVEPEARLPNDARYEPLEWIANGGFSEVREVWDHHVRRRIAMKTQLPSPRLAEDIQSFRQEVRIMARLQHPGIVPVYDWGELPDGRIWLTMKRVHGETIANRISKLHGLQGSEFAQALRRLLDDFRRLCEPVAYAHSQQIIHRDLSPHNLMIGEFGEVHVMDWGLAKDISTIAPPSTTPFHELDSITADATAVKLQTRAAGTPYYTPPEQARGDLAAIGPASDVYTLGAVLYEILSGSPPYQADCATSDAPARILRRVIDGPPRPIEVMARPDAPPELCALCALAMERNPKDRPANAGILMNDLRDWLDGANRLVRARRIVEDANRDHSTKIDTLRKRSEKLRQDARKILGRLRPFDPAQEKAKGWSLEDEATAIGRDILREEIYWTQKIRSALNEVPNVEEAHAALAEHYAQSLLKAEAEHDDSSALSYTALLQSHTAQLNGNAKIHYETLLQGDGYLTLVTEPEHAKIAVKPFLAVNRYLMPDDTNNRLLTSPIHELCLSRGTYLVEITLPGYRRVAYPVYIGRNEHWNGVRPGETAPNAIRLFSENEVGKDDIYIPAGWFIAGGDSRASESSLRQRVWVEDFIIRQHPVTSAEYLEFLNDLVDNGRITEAQRHCPLRFPGSLARDDEPFEYVIDHSTGKYQTRKPEADYALPVVNIDWYSAMAYASWFAQRTGLEWRLPSEFEWEKAARGVDGRFMPWGNQLEPTWACVSGCHPDRKHAMPVNHYPTDVSPYGVRGMAGNVRDWCIEPWKLDGPSVNEGILQIEPAAGHDDIELPVRGGAWLSAGDLTRLGVRYAERPSRRHGVLGFRLARSLAR